MAKQNVTNLTLMKMHNKLYQWDKGQELEFFFFASKIAEFKKLNGIRIQTMLKNLDQIDAEHYEHTVRSDGSIEVKMSKPKKGEQAVPVLKKGKTEQDWEAKTTEYLQQTTTIDI